MANGAVTTRPPPEKREQATYPAEEWTPPASEPIRVALLAAEKRLNDEIMVESWQQRCSQKEPEDNDDSLALEEANLERVSNLNDVMGSTIKEGI